MLAGVYKFNPAGPDLAAIALIAVIFFFLAPALLRWLWNMTIPQIFGVRPIAFWEAFRLILICGILFGRFPRWGQSGGTIPRHSVTHLGH